MAKSETRSMRYQWFTFLIRLVPSLDSRWDVVEVSERHDATFLNNYVKLETCRAWHAWVAPARDVGLRVAERIHATRTCCYLRATRRDPLIHLTADDNMDDITHCAMWSYQSG
jgi:hypothetical protein